MHGVWIKFFWHILIYVLTNFYKHLVAVRTILELLVFFLEAVLGVPCCSGKIKYSVALGKRVCWSRLFWGGARLEVHFLNISLPPVQIQITTSIVQHINFGRKNNISIQGKNHDHPIITVLKNCTPNQCTIK